MSNSLIPWDYLIITASNDSQARAYESQLELRRRLGFLPNVRNVLVVADPQGKRVGSGGSTIFCLIEVINREVATRQAANAPVPPTDAILNSLRILIVHAGGDSRRLPAYGPCGKIFIPVPSDSNAAFGAALFDRLISDFLAFPSNRENSGQIIITAGDALVLFDPSKICFDRPGLTAVTCHATPEVASKHGVFCPQADGRVSLYLQKPNPAEQHRFGAVNRLGQSLLDLGIMSFDTSVTMALFKAFGIKPSADGMLAWPEVSRREVMELGVDFYREVCCAMGEAATPQHHAVQAHGAGSKWSDSGLKRIFKSLNGIPFYISIVPRARFLHFGTTRQLISSGTELRQHDRGAVSPSAPLSLNNEILPGFEIMGANAWVEGCRIAAPLQLAGNNVVIGIEVNEPLSLPENACIDVLLGKNRKGAKVWFVRCHDIADTFKETAAEGGTYCGKPLLEWINALGVKPEDIWDSSIPAEQRSLWDARVFPAETKHGAYRDWLWVFNPANASPEQKQSFLDADRYSAAEIAILAQQDDFFLRRQHSRAQTLRPALHRLFQPESEFSARELAWVLRQGSQRVECAAGLLREIHNFAKSADAVSIENFQISRMLHSFGTAVDELAGTPKTPLKKVLPGLNKALSSDLQEWLRTQGLEIEESAPASIWARKARQSAFTEINRTILHSSMHEVEPPRNALRKDETVWGRAPARLELGGGWTDTPPYTLEYGGEVLNTAINLNGQPPIHCYGRVIDKPVIRIFSIDTGLHVEIREIDELLSFRDPRDSFGLVKAAFAISGFSPEITPRQRGKTLRQILKEFGGGVELTTLVGIPKGSGLGTSSILGAVIVAVLHHMIGRPLAQRELFHQVLRLEQALTTGGGWQDQVGGAVPGTKITYTQPGLFPDPRIHYVPSDILNPQTNGGTTLLYYTGLTRLAKNILQQVVGGFLNRDREIMATLKDVHKVARATVDAIARKDAAEFGHLTNVHLRLTKQLCPEVSNRHVEELLDRVRPDIYGGRLMGAGSGGFMMMICKSPEAAARIRANLEAKPLNECSRFFDFEVNNEGLRVTSC